MSVSLNEQETVIQISREGKTATVWTSDRTMMTKLDHLVDSSLMYTCEEVAKDQSGEIISKTYCIADKRLVSFRKNKVQMSEASRHALMERLARQRELRQ